MSERIVALSTVGSVGDAERIARALVERGLAACVNVVPGLVSFYRWQGALQRDAERLLLIKTRRERFEALCQALTELHPYRVPELIALPVEAGHAAYLEWLDQSVAPRGRAALRRPLPTRAPGRRAGRRRPRSPR